MNLALGPRIIQGGMGIGVSNWVLARAVSLAGQLGVVSGTCIDSVFIRRLQDGDRDGHVRAALNDFPYQSVCKEILDKYFLPEGRKPGQQYKLLPLHSIPANRFRDIVTVVGSFVEVHLAKMGHSGVVGLNLLTKIQFPTMATIYGAMLAGVDYILMGAGIPKEIPGVIESFMQKQKASLSLDLATKGTPQRIEFDPVQCLEQPVPDFKRPKFLPIIASNSLAMMLAKKASGPIDGFIVEGPEAGGHNAPPRESGIYNERGEPQYGPKDEVDFAKLAELGLPFWIAGNVGSAGGLDSALARGAQGIQVGTLFALCDESGIEPNLKKALLKQALNEGVDVRTDGRISPTGFPFKVVTMPGTLSDKEVYAKRERICDLGYLRTAFRRDDGKVAYRCASEPIKDYVKKGGLQEETEGRGCLCNSLMSTIGIGQQRDDQVEPPVFTSGDQLKNLKNFLAPTTTNYSAQQVISFLLGKEVNPNPFSNTAK